ncbi:VWA domain-containing protein [Sulfidibacter corallicola]|uniref:VWA domain-containing protein n=1 Tax=Sulfidibacter corallicola TaxID=2818388 RepID=A0A8A4TU50_SULCO|nr:vWA domain-containing protein [Sulfidibacter corallicola]QTD52562.1 VWA domain-containing protein [Sulfidibacter corallicola]
MALIWEPLDGPTWLIWLMLGAATLALLLRGLQDGWRILARTPTVRGLALGCSLLAALGLALAVRRPALQAQARQPQSHLTLVLDCSASALRAEEGLETYRRKTAARLRALLGELPDALVQSGTASLVSFGEDALVTAESIAMDKLPEIVGNLEPGDLARADASDLSAGLTRARDLGRHATRRAILLVSDGLETEGDALAEARIHAHQGLPIHVLPLSGALPDLGLTAVDLPRRVPSGGQTHLRGLIHNQRPGAVKAEVDLVRNGDPDARAQPAALTLDPNRWARLRAPVTFEGMGLQFLDVTLTDGSATHRHRRRFYTYVRRAPRLLAIGGDNRWTAAIGPDQAEITQIAAEDLPDTLDWRDFDGVVIADVAAHRFDRAHLVRMAAAVEYQGLGLFLVNGDHGDEDPKTPTVIKSYEGTPLEPLLPVETRPRSKDEEEPARHVIFLIDASGSMSGWRIEMAKTIAKFIIANYLSDKDLVDVMAFTTKPAHVVQRSHMTEANKLAAYAGIDSLRAGSGTNPTAALELLSRERLANCGLIFISDGFFKPVNYRPDCRATVFAIGHTTVPPHSPLHAISDPFPVDAGFDPGQIDMPYFDPEPRDHFFERGLFPPQRMDLFLRRGDRLPLSDLPMNGNAVTTPHADATVVAVRPKWVDPVLAYREVGLGRVGVLTSGIGSAWIRNKEGKEAIAAWITHTLHFTARDRYDFTVIDRGGPMDIEIALLARNGKAQSVDGLEVTWLDERGSRKAVPMRAGTQPGTFRGRLNLPRDRETHPGYLNIRELGPDAEPRNQRIPFLLPAAGEVQDKPGAEAQSHGQNAALLRALAEGSGGRYEPEPDRPLFSELPPQTRRIPVWPWLLAAAAAFYAIAIGASRWDGGLERP